MRLPTPPAATIIDTAAPYDKHFSETRFQYFLAFMTTICQSEGPRTITEVQRTAQMERHYSRFWSFLFDGEWAEDEIRRTQIDAVCEVDATTTLPDGRRVIVEAIDDTLNPKPFGPKLFGVSVHHNHAAKAHQSSYVLSHNHVLHGLIPDALNAKGARCYVTDAELYMPMDKTLESDRDTLAFENKLQLGALMTHRHADSFEADIVRYQLVDALYVKNPFLEAVRRDPMCHVLGRLQKNRALFELPPEKEPGTPGRPKKYGEKWAWKADFERRAEPCELVLYGKTRKLKVLSKTVKIRKYDDPVLIIISQFADAPKSKPTLFLCTDATLDAKVALQLYAARFSLEEAIKDLRQACGFGTEMVRGKCQWLRYVRMFLLAQCWLRCLADHQPESVAQTVRDPWRKAQNRMTIGQVKQALRYESLTGRRVLASFRQARNLPKTPMPASGNPQSGAASPVMPSPKVCECG
jgi:hypothetical protein